MPAKPLTEAQTKDAVRLKYLFKAWQADRKAAGEAHSQEHVSDQLGFNQSALSQYLGGRIPLNAQAAAGFARLLSVDVEEFSPTLAAEIAKLAETHVPRQS